MLNATLFSLRKVVSPVFPVPKSRMQTQMLPDAKKQKVVFRLPQLFGGRYADSYARAVIHVSANLSKMMHFVVTIDSAYIKANQAYAGKGSASHANLLASCCI
jgi:hypothetical protein